MLLYGLTMAIVYLYSVKKLLAYPLSILYYLAFGLTLVVFELAQRLTYFLFGYQAHKKSVDWLQFFLMRSLNLVGTRYQFHNQYQIPTDRPAIIVANHQSMYDISPLIWYLRKHHPKFISKKELGKGIPSISFNLKYGGSVLIDRKNKKESVQKIEAWARSIAEHNHGAVIFPEGTRSKTGIPKSFQITGLLTLFEQIPNAVVIPVTLENTWKITKWGNFPLFPFVKVKLTVHEPTLLEKSENKHHLVSEIEQKITSSL